MNELDEIIKLLQNEETINLALHLICKEYNFRIIQQKKYDSQLLGRTNYSCIFITKYNLKTEQDLIYELTSRFKKSIYWQRASSTLSLDRINKHYTKSGHEKISIAWVVKK